MIPSPYLLYLGSATDELSVKTSRGIAYWRPEESVGEYRGEGCGVTLGLPVLDFAAARAAGAKTLVLGVANAGGVMGPEARDHVLAALAAGLNVASGLHDRLNAYPDLVEAARAAGLSLFDVREPPADLKVGTGRPRAGHRLLTVGTDCSVGKMYTTLALEREMRGRGIGADFRATGQTGIFIAQSGVPLDAVIADFISGAVEAIAPARHDGGWDLIEGQGSLYHPSFAGVSLGLLHGAQPEALVMCHEWGRPGMRGIADRKLPGLAECMATNLDAVRLTSPHARFVGIAINTSKLDPAEARRVCDQVEDELGLPAQDPVAMGVDKIVDRLLQCPASSAAA